MGRLTRSRTRTAGDSSADSAPTNDAAPITPARRKGKKASSTSLQPPPSEPPSPQAVEDNSSTPQARRDVTPTNPPDPPHTPESSPLEIPSSSPPPSKTAHARPQIHILTQGHATSEVDASFFTITSY